MMLVLLLISTFLAFSASAQAGTVKIPKSDYVWEPYPEDTLPLFQKAFRDIAASRSKMALLYHAWNILPQNGIYVAPDDLIASNDFSTEGPNESTAASQQDGAEPTTIGDRIHSVQGSNLDAFQERLGMAFSDLDEAALSDAFIGLLKVGGRPRVVHVRGTAGEDFPNYQAAPETSFNCSEQGYIPGFYADLETGCQGFHLCWPHKKDTLLCPIGTIFNQATLSCDFWYTVNCSLTPLLYDRNAHVPKAIFDYEPTPSDVKTFIDWALGPYIVPVWVKTEIYPEGAVGHTIKRRHVPKKESTTTAAAEERQEAVHQPTSPRLLPEVSTTSPLKRVRTNSKFPSFFQEPLFVIRRVQRELKDVEEETEGTTTTTTTTDSEETQCLQKLQSFWLEIMAESLEQLEERYARLTVSAQ